MLNKKKLAPIIFFTYNRLWHTQQTMHALQKNILARESELFIFSDGSKDQEDSAQVNMVRQYIESIKDFKNVTIVKHNKNVGLADSIIQGVTTILNRWGKAIIIEDDIVSSKFFLAYLNNALDYYQLDNKIFSITGYNHSDFVMDMPKSYQDEVYFCPRPSCWGWATWKDRWQKVDWQIKDFKNFLLDSREQRKFNLGGDDLSQLLIDQKNNKINSWAIRWAYHHYKYQGFCVYPVQSYVNNIGLDGSGVHCGKTTKYNHTFLNNRIAKFISFKIDKKIIKQFKKVYKKNIIKKTIRFLKKLI